MSKPSTSTVPFTRASGTSSCMRLRQRTKVDLPHPEGPIMAVMLNGAIERFTSWSACLRPYQAFTFSTITDTFPLLPHWNNLLHSLLPLSHLLFEPTCCPAD